MSKVEYVLSCKRFLRVFGLYHFKNDGILIKIVTTVWMFFIGFLFILTALQALYQQINRGDFNMMRDSPGILTFCKSIYKDLFDIFILIF